MSSKHTYLAAIVVLLTLLFVSFALAQAVPMQVTLIHAGEAACAGTNVPYGFSIRNTGTVEETYTFSVSDYADYISYSAEALTIAPGQSKNIFLWFSAPEDLHGDFPFTFSITAKSSRVQADMQINHKVDACADYRVELGKFSTVDEKTSFTSITSNIIPACQEAELKLPILITNQATFQNAYEFKLEGPDWASMNGDYLELLPSQQGILTLTFTPELADTGSYQFDLFITSAKGDLTQKLTFFVDLSSCFPFSIEFEEATADVCCSETQHQVVLKNEGTEDATFNLGVVEDTFATLSKSKVTIPAGGNSSFYMTLVPSCTEEKETAQTITVYAEVETEEFTVRRSDSLPVTVHEQQVCYDVDVKRIDSVFNSRVIKNDYERRETKLAVKNIGKADATYDVSLEGPIWSWTDTHEITVAAGEEAELTIMTDVGEDIEEGEYPIVLTLTPINKDISFQFAFEGRVGKGGFLSGLSSYLLYIVIAIILLVIIIVILNKSMHGRKEKPTVAEAPSEPLYTSDKDLEKARKEEEKRLKDEQRRAAKEETLAAKRAQERIVQKSEERKGFPWGALILIILIFAFAFIGYSYYQSLDITDTGFEPTETGSNPTGGTGVGMQIANENDTYIEPDHPGAEVPTLNCTLDYTPVCGVDNVTYGNDCQRDAAGVDLAYEGECVVMEGVEVNKTVEANAEINVSIVEGNETEPLPEWMTADFEESFTYHVWNKNEPLTINLSENFKDPDGDELIYDYEGGKNMIVEFDGSMVTITPVWDFLGRDKIIFTATDGKSEPIYSPEVILDVQEPSIEVPEFGFLEPIRGYTWYIVLGIIILIIAIVILRLTEEDDEPKPVKKKIGKKASKKRASKK